VRTSNRRDCCAGACARQPKTCDGRQGGGCAGCVGDDERRAPSGLVYPVIDGVFGALVDGEGDGSDERDAEKGRPDTCCARLVSSQVAGDGKHTAPEAI
jgi:hypothetical protein